MADLSVDDYVEELGRTVGHALLEPTRIYVRAVRKLLGHYRVKAIVHGVAHITGGGIRDNLERILPEGAQAVIRRGSWPVPPIFSWLARLGNVDPDEMDRVFNMGIGLVLVVRPFFADSVQSQLSDSGLSSFPIGRIIEGPTSVVWE